MMVVVLFGACMVSRVSTESFEPAGSHSRELVNWETVLANPSDISVNSISFATAETRTAGLVNMAHPKTAELTTSTMPISIAAHVVTHPEHGTFLIDTGLAVTEDGRPDLRGVLARAFPLSVEASTADVADDVAGVFVTHMHMDHLLGLPAIPDDVPVIIGPNELSVRNARNVLLRRNVNYLLGSHPIQALDFSSGNAADVFGDGSLWALHMPGHTPGSVAYLVNASDGPVLLTGDASHTRWGWENGVEPGRFSEDIPGSAVSLAWMRDLVDANPQISVAVGHELPHVAGVAAPDELEEAGPYTHHGPTAHRFNDVERWVAVFDAADRDSWQRPEAVVDAMAIESGMAVADIGAGTGYFMPHLASAVGEDGRVYAVDVEDALVNHLIRRAHSTGLEQVSVIRGEFGDPKLSEDSVDRILIVNTYHHISDRTAYFTALHSAVREGGMLVIVDYNLSAEHGPPVEHRLSEEQVTAELLSAGWQLHDAPAILDDQYVLLFVRTPE